MSRKDDYLDVRWKERAEHIRKLDNYRCVMCGAKDKELHVHHLSYPPPPFHLWDATDDELVTLCKDCHKKIHRLTKRPKFNELREFFDLEMAEPGYDCMDCKHFWHQYHSDKDIDKRLFEYEGYCEQLGGVGCSFIKVTRCKDCAFIQSCDASPAKVACGEFMYKTCLTCRNFLISEDSFNGFCSLLGKETYGSDGALDLLQCAGENFVCVATNRKELIEFLKQYD